MNIKNLNVKEPDQGGTEYVFHATIRSVKKSYYFLQ